MLKTDAILRQQIRVVTFAIKVGVGGNETNRLYEVKLDDKLGRR